MSMLQSFFEIGKDKTLFDGLRISDNQELCEEYQGKFPVVSVSLKGINGATYEEARRFRMSMDWNVSFADTLRRNSASVLSDRPVPFTIDGSEAVVTVTQYNMPQKGQLTITKTGEVFASVQENDGLYNCEDLGDMA